MDHLREAALLVEQDIFSGKDHLGQDTKFHICIAQCTQNLVVPKLIPIITYSVELFGSLNGNVLLSETVSAHRAITSAICTRDAKAAEQAMAQGMGVCQDYAHILLSLCRLEGIPCRYAAGLLPGEGESHAWVDIYDGGCWTALDPTHDRRALDGYIRFSTGQDSAACSISRGIFRGFARQEQTIHAWVSEEEEL